MDDKELEKYLLEEENHAFQGWDFSYLDKRWESTPLPWDYKSIVLKYLNQNKKILDNNFSDTNILDIGTGGGEFLLSLNHPYEKTSCTEAYEPNIKLCKETLVPKGIKLYPLPQYDEKQELQNIPSEEFDIVIDRHEAFSEPEVYRVLKEDGYFITQQVGAYNNKDLATYFDENHTDEFPNMTLEKTIKRLIDNGFEIIYSCEAYPKLHFFDIGVIVFFAKIISWEFKGFSVEKSFDKLKELDRKIKEKGYIESTEHRFIIIAKKVKQNGK